MINGLMAFILTDIKAISQFEWQPIKHALESKRPEIPKEWLKKKKPTVGLQRMTLNEKIIVKTYKTESKNGQILLLNL